MKRLKVIVGMLFILIIANVMPVLAGGGGSYPNGSEGFLSGLAPPAGFYGLSYTEFYTANTKKDNSGNNINAFDKLSIRAEVIRFIWISKHKILGGNYGQHIFFPFLHVDLDFNKPVGPKGKRHYSDNNLPYIIYSPFVWTFHKMSGKLHFIFVLADTYIPTGNQDDDNLANISHNYWTFEPVFATTYLPTENWALSIKLMYDWNTKQDNSPTVYGFNVDRTPGQEFHFDYSVSYQCVKDFRVGLTGYAYMQTTDDDYDIDPTIPAPVQKLLKSDERHHSTKFAIGPGLWYHHKNMFFVAKAQPEISARNATRGATFWFKFTYAF